MHGHDQDEHVHDHHGHEHDHGHGHHGHSHAPKDFGAAFAIGAALNAGFVIFEVILGFSAHSVALLSDAGHNLSDVLALLMAWGASCLGKIPPAGRHTYGYRRSSILAVNLFTALLFVSGNKDDLNARGAYLHMAADAAIAFGVVVAGFLIWWTGFLWIDPVISLVIGGVIVAGTWRLLRDSCNLALDAVPEGIDLAAVETHLRSYSGITDIHHLHIWAMSTTEVALTVHLVKTDGVLDNELLHRIQDGLKDEFHIEHTTIQLECGLNNSLPCEKADC
jgi:cobalt-zinc-cadmium efflux system protein